MAEDTTTPQANTPGSSSQPLSARLRLNRSLNTPTSNQSSASRSLIRPDRAVISPDDRNFFYNLRTIEANASISVQPSNTGNDPTTYAASYHSTKEQGTASSTSIEEIPRARSPGSVRTLHTLRSERQWNIVDETEVDSAASLDTAVSLARQKQLVLYDPVHNHSQGSLRKSQHTRRPQQPAAKPLSLWQTYCKAITFLFFPMLLRAMGLKDKNQQTAWREKIGLVSIIVGLTGFVAFFTFAFNRVVCGMPLPRTHFTDIPTDSVVVHGTIYNLSALVHNHPQIPQLHQKVKIVRRNGEKKYSISMTPSGLVPLGEYAGGHDASLLFQNVNGNCAPFIKPANVSANTHQYFNELGEFSQYFPCVMLDLRGQLLSPLARDHPPQRLPLQIPNYAVEFKDSCHLAPQPRNSFYALPQANNVCYSWDDVARAKGTLAVYLGDVVDLGRLKLFKDVELVEPLKTVVRHAAEFYGHDISAVMSATSANRDAGKCLVELAKVGLIETDSVGCITSHVVLYLSLTFILTIVLVKFAFALYFEWFLSWRLGTDLDHVPLANAAASIRSVRTSVSSVKESLRNVVKKPDSHQDATLIDEASTGSVASAIPQSAFAGLPSCKSGFLQGQDSLISTLFLVTSYSESEEGIRTTLDSLATCSYPNDHKLVIIICDGLITGSGNSMSTPDIVLSMVENFVVPPEETEAYSYVAIASDAKRHNMAKAYAGYYKYSDKTTSKDQHVPLPVLVVNKCGLPWEQATPGVKAGNRGKRDSQVLLMSFLQKAMFNERMTDLENYMYMLLWKLVNCDVMDYETVLMVDADTKIHSDALEHLISCMMKDPNVMGLCGETQIANKRESWVTMIQVFEYFISHHLTKSFESVFGGVTCLPGCFSLYRIKSPKGPKGYWVPILANPDIVERYSDNQVTTLHRKNLLLLGEDRYLSTLMLKTFPKRKQLFVPQAKCETIAPSEFRVLLDQRRRWINSTVHNLMELVIVRDLCGVFCVSMQCVVLIELIGTLTLPAALAFTLYLLFRSIIERPIPLLPLMLLGLILGLPGILILVTAHQWSYVLWMLIYLLSLPIWNFVLPLNAFWKFDDFSWGTTRQIQGEDRTHGDEGPEKEGQGEGEGTVVKKRTFREWLEWYNNGGSTPVLDRPGWKWGTKEATKEEREVEEVEETQVEEEGEKVLRVQNKTPE